MKGHSLRSKQLPRALWLMPVLTLLAFAALLAVLLETKDDKQGVLELVLQAAGLAGFVGLFGQFFVSFAQEMHKRKLFRVSFIAKDGSPFSNALLGSVQAYFADIGEFTLKNRLVKTATTPDAIALDVENAIAADEPDGMIIRPSEVSEKLVQALIHALSRGIFIVLVDIDIRQEKFPNYLSRHPFFVGSHFTDGGALVADHIGKFMKATEEPAWAYLLLGPESASSAVYRGRSVAWNLYRQNRHQCTRAIWLANWDRQDALKQLFAAMSEDDMEQVSKASRIYVFCGNDNIASALLDAIVHDHDSPLANEHRALIRQLKTRDLQITGYDGLTDEDGFKLKQYRRSTVSVATIDVKPLQMGKLAAEVMHRGLQGNLPAQQRQELITPQLITFDHA